MVTQELLIDTNIYTHAMKGDPEIVLILRRCLKIGICAISIGELLSGFKGGTREGENREELNQFLDSYRVYLYSIDEKTAEFYSAILNDLRKIGKPIPTNDIWIASVAAQHGLRMFTKDVHFKYIPGLLMYDFIT
ncbi:MAG: type II toxin-antitoxin system VapC family toxin [bacterium]